MSWEKLKKEHEIEMVALKDSFAQEIQNELLRREELRMEEMKKAEKEKSSLKQL